MKITNKNQLYRLICYSKSALYVSSDVFAHYQGYMTIFTVSGSVHPSCCGLVSRRDRVIRNEGPLLVTQ
jgi:hypothetical protein